MKKLKLCILLLAMSGGFTAYAQQKTTTTDSLTKHKVKEIFVNVGLQYISNLTYAGRREESSVPILLPTLTLISRHGFFLSGIGYFDLNGSKSDAEGLSVTPGYVFAFDKATRYYGGNISVTKYFITNNSPIILSAFDATIDGQLYANPKNIVKFTVGGSYRFNKNSDKNDIVNTVEVSKEVYAYRPDAKKFDGLKFIPTVTLYTGTQSFYETVNMIEQNPLAGITNPTQTTTTKETRRYDFLALSGSLQATYVIGKVQLSFTPYLIQPYNQIDYTTNTRMNGLYFLFTTGASVTF